MLKFYFSLLLSIFSMTLMAQKNGTVKGIAFDETTKEGISSATVSILDKKDSSLVSFTMTDNKGAFEVKSLPNGDFRVLITHINYHSKAVVFSISDNEKQKDLGHILMNDKNKTLDEVVIMREEPPVTLVGDTVQYNAGSFKTVPNASVEQLLKKLPGVEVDKDGTIKAQGEKVTRVLVDGKEFFGNDPKMATKNLPADAIEKVQVYNKQSEQAQLTGFEDGNYEKTINLKLKKDKKKGMFGKVMAGGGTNDRLEARGNVNAFKGARQLSAIALGNNTNAEGFSFMDILNFNGSMGRMMSGGSSTMTLSSADAAAMGFSGSGRGVNTIWGSGINYNNIIGTKLDLQSSYFYNHYNPDMESHSRRQYIREGYNNLSNSNSYSQNINNSHRLNMNLLYQIDSFHSIRFTPNISLQQTRNQSNSDNDMVTETGTKVNDGISRNGSNGNGYNFKNEIMFRKKFRQRGRTFSATLQNNFNGSNSDGNQWSHSQFYTSTGSLFREQTLNQHNHMAAGLQNYSARLVYTEPILKRSLLEFNVNKSNNVNTSDIVTYDYNPFNSKYDQLNDSLTNNFRNTYGFTNAGLRLRTQKNKWNYTIGVNWQEAELQGKIISDKKDSVMGKTFDNLLWTARFQYNISKFRYFAINYNTSTNQPSLSQLQPVPDVSNSLYIRYGNPDLKQEYTHTVQGNLNLVRPFENKNLFFFVTFQTTQNKIINTDSLDKNTGIRYSRPINVDAVYNLNNSVSYGMPIRFLKGTVEFRNSTSYYMGKQFVDTALYNNNNLSLAPGVRFNINPYDKLNIVAGYNLNYTSNRNTDYFTHQYSTSLEWELPKQFFFATDFTYTVNSQKTSGFNQKVPYWNASISRQMLRFNRGEIKLSATDLLNQNVGISHNAAQNNYVEDVRTKTLPRFFLLSFTYSLTKTGLNRAGGMRINVR